jgi:hypothetical protein
LTDDYLDTEGIISFIPGIWIQKIEHYKVPNNLEQWLLFLRPLIIHNNNIHNIHNIHNNNNNNVWLIWETFQTMLLIVYNQLWEFS